MADRAVIGREVQNHFEKKWSAGDPWDLATSDFEIAKYHHQLALLGNRPYRRALEIGCGNGVFTRMLAERAEHVVGLDVAPSAIELARAAGDAAGRIDFRVQNVMEFDPRADGPWDLIVLSETVPYIGWLYPLFDVAWLARELCHTTSDGGHLIMANTCGGVSDYLLRPWLVHTYRDLFTNVGYSLEREDLFRGTKDGVAIESLICLFEKRP